MGFQNLAKASNFYLFPRVPMIGERNDIIFLGGQSCWRLSKQITEWMMRIPLLHQPSLDYITMTTPPNLFLKPEVESINELRIIHIHLYIIHCVQRWTVLASLFLRKIHLLQQQPPF